MREKWELNALKRKWMADPSFKIEDTAGFEDHYDELRLWRETVTQFYTEEGAKAVRLLNLSATMDEPGNFVLANLIDQLQAKDAEMAGKLAQAETLFGQAREAIIELRSADSLTKTRVDTLEQQATKAITDLHQLAQEFGQRLARIERKLGLQ